MVTITIEIDDDLLEAINNKIEAKQFDSIDHVISKAIKYMLLRQG